jgi:excisionase family DNA binding protein
MSRSVEVAAYGKILRDSITAQAFKAGLAQYHVVLRVRKPASPPPPIHDPAQEGLLTYSQLAERLGTSEGWVRRNARRSYTSNPIPSVRLGKNVLFDWSKVQIWLKRRGK